MSDWKSFCLGDVCVINANSYSKNCNWTFVNYLDTGNITANKIESIQHINILEEKLPSRARRKVKTDSIIYSTVRPNQRHCGIIKSQPKNFLVSTGFAVIDVNPEIVDANFLYYRLTQDEVVQHLQSIAEQSTTAYPSIRPIDIGNLKFNLPPLETQKKIAAVLSAFDDKIELNNAINKNLEEQAQAIYKNMFFDNFNPAWRKCRADEVFNISIGKTPPRKEHQWFTQDSRDITWVSISDMGSCGVYIGKSSEYLTAEAVKKFNVRKVPRNTVILSFKLTVGRVAITDRELATNEAIAHFVTDDSSMTEYLYLYLKNFSYQTMGSTSSIATAINSKIIKAMPFIVPEEEDIYTFHNLVEPLFLTILNNQHENLKLGEIRDVLLPRLMSGEIDVSTVEI